MTSRIWPERYEALDAWRGVAALAVVLHHQSIGHNYNLGHNAVLIFFVISGYCIAASADSCLRKGLGFRAYMWRRIRRIYPPYLFALLFFFATRILKSQMSGDWQFPSTWAAWVQNLTLTQWITLLFHPKSWAADNPTLTVAAFWSLNYEEQFYLVVGLLMVTVGVLRFPLWTIGSVLFATAVGWNFFFPSICYGIFIEYWVLFAIGSLVFFQLCRIRNRYIQQLISVSLVILFIVSVYMTWFAGIEWGTGQRVVYREWVVGCLFSLLLIVLRPYSGKLGSWAVGRLLLKLGAISYSLYLTHQFNLTFSSTISGRLLWRGAPYYCHLVIQVAILLIIASVFWYFCERPFLNKSLVPSKKKWSVGVPCSGHKGGEAWERGLVKDRS